MYRSKFTLSQRSLPSGYSGERALSTAIYYMLTPDTLSIIHRLKGDEVYHFYLGDPAEMLILKADGTGRLCSWVKISLQGCVCSRSYRRKPGRAHD